MTQGIAFEKMVADYKAYRKREEGANEAIVAVLVPTVAFIVLGYALVLTATTGRNSYAYAPTEATHAWQVFELNETIRSLEAEKYAAGDMMRGLISDAKDRELEWIK